MGTATANPKEITLNIRLDSALKADFMAVTEQESRSAAEVLRDLMRQYVLEARRKEFAAEAERQSKLLAAYEAETGTPPWFETVAESLPDEPDDPNQPWYRSPGESSPDQS